MSISYTWKSGGTTTLHVLEQQLALPQRYPQRYHNATYLEKGRHGVAEDFDHLEIGQTIYDAHVDAHHGQDDGQSR